VQPQGGAVPAVRGVARLLDHTPRRPRRRGATVHPLAGNAELPRQQGGGRVDEVCVPYACGVARLSVSN
jgi:hypothetical protein